MFTKLSKELKEFGLSDNEISVYVTLLQLGSAPASEISKIAGLNRSTTYVQLTTLMDFGLVSTFKKLKKTFFTAESPTNLERLIDIKINTLRDKKENIHQLIPDLIDFYEGNVGKPHVRAFSGKEGFKTMRRGVIESEVKEYFVAMNMTDAAEHLSKEEMMDFSNKRASAGILAHTIYSKEGRDNIKVPPQELMRLSDPEFPIESEVYIYGDTVSFASTKDNIVGVTIVNKNIAETFKTIFRLAWLGIEQKNKNSKK